MRTAGGRFDIPLTRAVSERVDMVIASAVLEDGRFLKFNPGKLRSGCFGFSLPPVFRFGPENIVKNGLACGCPMTVNFNLDDLL